MTFQPEKNNHWWLAILSGILLWSAWAEGALGFLLHTALIPLLIIESELSERPYKKKATRYFLLLLLSFTLWHSLSAWSTTRFETTTIIIRALMSAIPMMLFFFTKKAAGNIAGYFSLIMYWIAFEYIYSYWGEKTLWPILGNGFSSLNYLIQWYEITGSQGGSSWILAGNLILFHSIQNRRINSLGITIFAMLFIIPSSISLIRYLSYHNMDHPYKVIIIEPFSRLNQSSSAEYTSMQTLHDGFQESRKDPETSSSLPHKPKNGGEARGRTTWLTSPTTTWISKKNKRARSFIQSGLFNINQFPTGETITGRVRQGARFIVLIANQETDAHIQYTRLRSIETRRDIILVSEGESVFHINQKGDIMDVSIFSEPPPKLQGNDIRLNDLKTFYVKYGDYIGISSLYFSLICIFILLGGILVNRTNFI